MLKSKFFAVLENGKQVDLPYTYETLDQATIWLDSHHNAESIHERLRVYDSKGVAIYKTYNVTNICLDRLSVIHNQGV